MDLVPTPPPVKPRVDDPQALLASLRKIERMVGRFLREALSIDPENIACDIWVDLWTRGVDPSWTHVHNRCVDAIRRATTHRERGIPDDYDLPEEPSDSPNTDPQEQLNKLMKCPWLTHQDKELVFNKYYRSQTDVEIAYDRECSRETVTKHIASVLEKLRTWAFVQAQGDLDDTQR